MVTKAIGNIRVKLTGSSGLSFLIALLFILVSATIAAVIISSAGVNAERAKQHKVEEQGYFAVQSALSLVNDSSRKEAGGILNDQADQKLVMTGALNNLQYSRQPATNDLGLSDWAQQQAKNVGQGRPTSPKVVTIPSFTYEGATVPSVQLVYQMKGKGSFDIQVEAREVPTPGSSESTIDYANALYLYYSADVGSVGDGTYRVEWKEREA